MENRWMCCGGQKRLPWRDAERTRLQAYCFETPGPDSYPVPHNRHTHHANLVPRVVYSSVNDLCDEFKRQTPRDGLSIRYICCVCEANRPKLLQRFGQSSLRPRRKIPHFCPPAALTMNSQSRRGDPPAEYNFLPSPGRPAGNPRRRQIGGGQDDFVDRRQPRAVDYEKTRESAGLAGRPDFAFSRYGANRPGAGRAASRHSGAWSERARACPASTFWLCRPSGAEGLRFCPSRQANGRSGARE